MIHRQVDAMGIDFNGTLAQPLAMHSGIASGQVVTGKSDHDPCGRGFTGHAVAQASYLRDMAENGEILLCRETAGATSESYALDPVCIRKDRRQSKGFVFKINDPYKAPLPVKKSLEGTVLLE